MKPILATFLSLTLGASAFATPRPLFENYGTITNDIPIDAISFFNGGTFTNIFRSLPYDMSNVRYFTNRGVMSGSVGFQFDNIDTTLNTRRPMDTFFNASRANISAIDTGLEVQNGFFFFGSAVGTASYLKVAATNLVNHGSLSVGSIGLMKLTGKTVDLSRGSLFSGDLFSNQTNLFGSGGFFFVGQNSFGVEDIYGGVGSQSLTFDGNLGITPPDFVFSPLHFVQFRSAPGGIGGFPTSVTVPRDPLSAEFEAHANIIEFPTTIGVDKQIQVVFVRTNFADTNISAQVRFVDEGFLGDLAIVQLSTLEADPISGQSVTNAIYVFDNAGEFGSIFAITNVIANSSIRPSNYQITTSMPFEWQIGELGNTDYDPSLIFPGDQYQDRTVSATYSGYAAQVGRNPELSSGLTGSTNAAGIVSPLLFPDPTNQAGRIEIDADVLDLSLARIRTEGLLSLNARHLKGNGAADVSVGIINANLASTNGFLTISNIFPSQFKRVRGDIYAYSAIWNNTETNSFETNHNQFHILILDHALKADFKPTIRNLALRATNLVIRDDLSINRSVRFEAENLTFDGTVTLSETAVDLLAANLVGVKTFLNESNSIFQGANTAAFGYDTERGYASIINRGTISATAPLFKASEFQNSGTIIAGNGGNVRIFSDVADLSNGAILADGDIQIATGDLTVTNSVITAGRKLTLNVTDFISDFGTNANNVWQVSDGFSLPRRPFRGDLLGTEIRTLADGHYEVEHDWAGEDVGPGPDGFVNNAALGRLVLDIRSQDAPLAFNPAGFQNALYVRTLDVEFGSSIDINTPFRDLIKIDPNFRIYFVDSNAAEKLTDSFSNIVQVASFDSLVGATPVVVKVNGLGVITPNLDGRNLEVGNEYRMKAVPAAGQIFAGWSGTTNATGASLTFQMRRNAFFQANFRRNPLDEVKGAYNGLFFATNGVQHETSGSFTFNVTKKGLINGTIVSGKSYRFNGTFNADGSAQLLVKRETGKSPLTVNLQLDLTDGSDRVHGSVSAENWISVLEGDRANVRPFAVSKNAQYTMVIPGNTNSAGPVGDGFATMKADAAGGLHFSGMLADGTKFNQRVPVSKNGQVPLYLPLYRGAGSVLSWISLTNDAEGGSVQGNLSWIKKPAAKGIYRSGFTNQTSVIGSSYVPPTSGSRVLNLIDGTVSLNGGDLSSAIESNASVESNNTVTISGTNGVSLSFSLPSGLLNGAFANPLTARSAAIKGVVLQEQNQARGFFLGTTQSGNVTLKNN